MEDIRIHASSIEFTKEVKKDPDLKKLVRRIINRAAAISIAVSTAGFLFVFKAVSGKRAPIGTAAAIAAVISFLALLAGVFLFLGRGPLTDKYQEGLLDKMQEDHDPKFSTFSTSILLGQKRADAIRIPGYASFSCVNMRSESDKRAALFVIDDRAIRAVDFDDMEEFRAFEKARQEGKDILLTADRYLW